MGKHIFYLDNLRTCMVFLSILCLSLVSFLPLPAVPLFAVYDKQALGTGMFYYLFYECLAALVIPVLFFLSGYFSASNLRIRTLSSYFHDRWQRLGWPWLFAALLIVPELAWLGILSRGFHIFFMDYLSRLVHGSYITLGAYGMLAILLLFTFLLMAVKKVNHQALQRKAASTPAPLFLLAFVVLHGLFIFAFSRLWLAAFQLHAVAAAQLFMTVSGFRFSWVITAALYFVLGCYACRHRWFTPGGYVPGRFWLAAALVCLMLYILTPAVYADYAGVLLSFTGTLGLIAAFAAKGNQSGKTAVSFAHMAYPLWYLSIPSLQAATYFLLPLNLAIPLKILLSLLLTLVYGYLVCKYALSYLACFKVR